MTWERFGYICRKASVESKENESVKECLIRVENEKSCDLYGDKFKSNSWPRKILDEIGNIQDESAAKDAIQIYKNINLTLHSEAPMKFKRVIAYLSYVVFVFYIVSAIYYIKVVPTFIDFMEGFNTSIYNQFILYEKYFDYFILFFSVLLIFALMVGSQVNKLFKFNIGFENDFIIRYVLFPSIRKSYAKIVNVLEFPTLCSVKFNTKNSNQVTSHLRQVKDSNMCVAKEMQVLIEIEMQELLINCEKQMKVISFVVAITVVSAIIFFLVSAYSPIFMLGDTI